RGACEARDAARSGNAVPVSAGLRFWFTDRCRIPLGEWRSVACAAQLVAAVTAVACDRLRDLGHAAADGACICGAREWWRTAGAAARARSAYTGRPRAAVVRA